MDFDDHFVSNLTRTWKDAWGDIPPISCKVRESAVNQWVRIYGLREGKRWPQTEAEYNEVIDRFKSVIKVSMDKACGITVVLSFEVNSKQNPYSLNFPGRLFFPWMEVTDSDGIRFALWYARAIPFGNLVKRTIQVALDDGINDSMLIFDDGSFVHPYDGGIDVFKATDVEAGIGRIRATFSDFLSELPSGM